MNSTIDTGENARATSTIKEIIIIIVIIIIIILIMMITIMTMAMAMTMTMTMTMTMIMVMVMVMVMIMVMIMIMIMIMIIIIVIIQRVTEGVGDPSMPSRGSPNTGSHFMLQAPAPLRYLASIMVWIATDLLCHHDRKKKHIEE